MRTPTLGYARRSVRFTFISKFAENLKKKTKKKRINCHTMPGENVHSSLPALVPCTPYRYSNSSFAFAAVTIPSRPSPRIASRVLGTRGKSSQIQSRSARPATRQTPTPHPTPYPIPPRSRLPKSTAALAAAAAAATERLSCRKCTFRVPLSEALQTKR